jgi:ankyrin repeat protein
VQYLLENGANPVVEDAHGNTPADVAHNEEIKELIHVSADMREIHKSCA